MPTPSAPVVPYVPQAVYCYPVPHATVLPGPLCSRLPGNIGPDPELNVGTAYNGIGGSLPTSFNRDAQTPFDNLSWQTFVALNWTAGKQDKLPAEGLAGDGQRVWQSWSRVSSVFGNSPIQANCHPPLGMQTFSIGAYATNKPAPQNEEYIQAATGDPAIDVDGNWTLYERRVNGIEIAYLKAPGGNKTWDLTTGNGQTAFIAAQQKVNFPAAAGIVPNGAMEIKAAWRLLDPAKHAANAKRFYIVKAMLMVQHTLVLPARGKSAAPDICAPVELGLVAMHIIQKNPLTTNSLKPQWFWSTFEQVDNAPLAQSPCDPAQPAVCQPIGQTACPPASVNADYSYYNAKAPDMLTNQPPQFLFGGKAFIWSQKEPYAAVYLRTAKNGMKVGTQVSRCWSIYALTQQLNTQWRAALHKAGSVFENYMLVGTQWGATTTNPPDPKIAFGGVPNFLSNSVVETYLQLSVDPKNPFGNGSCISCHVSATLNDNKTPSNLSFLPNLAQKDLQRRSPLPPQP